ncbi:MAG: type II secretion system minor pseudopilin GspI [Proteobacteria bacterium]|nr:type II secretion system minor pseudopilin GspI [Pseudomonadota bacterium]
MKKISKHSGFTLLEVMVSLLILTVALSAIITVGSSRAETLIELRMQNRALIVANNILEKYTDIQQAISVGVIDGIQANGNVDWNWQLTVSPTNNDSIYRMDVKVSKDSSFDYSFAQLVAFKWR